jgi:hypothetical protein
LAPRQRAELVNTAPLTMTNPALTAGPPAKEGWSHRRPSSMAARTSASDSLAFDLRRIRCCRSLSPWTRTCRPRRPIARRCDSSAESHGTSTGGRLPTRAVIHLLPSKMPLVVSDVGIDVFSGNWSRRSDSTDDLLITPHRSRTVYRFWSLTSRV